MTLDITAIKLAHCDKHRLRVGVCSMAFCRDVGTVGTSKLNAWIGYFLWTAGTTLCYDVGWPRGSSYIFETKGVWSSL